MLSSRPAFLALTSVMMLGLAAGGQAAEPPTLAPPLGAKGTSPDLSAACADGLVDDDGTAESGYGWVPSVTSGVYVQEYSGIQVPSGALRSVCVCWLRTRDDDSLDFEVVLYGSTAKGAPEEVPYAVFPAQVSELPPGFAGASFTEVPLDDAPVPDDTFFVGVRWNPSVDSFFFTCTDQTAAAEPTRVFFRDDRAPGWSFSGDTADPVFDLHHAMLVRPVPSPALFDVPVGSVPLALLAALLGLAGAWLLRRT